MIVENNIASDVKIAYIGGGSRGWAWGLMSDLAMQSQISGCVELYDIDAEAAADNAIIGNLHNHSPATRSEWRYRVAPSLDHALRGADFVVVSILPGTLSQMSAQIDACERMGIYHSVGDTIGPAGLARSLRTIPFYAHLARRIAALCPDAWVINYTNPMTVCVRTMSAAFDRIKLVGCCHEVFGTQNLIARAAQESLGIEAIDRHELNTVVTGINHFTWITAASWRHVDLMPMYMNFAQRHAETGFTFDGVPESWRSSCFSSASRVKFDLALRHGAIAAAGDRHLAEFAPTLYLKDPTSVEQWKFHLTPMSYRLNEAIRRAQAAQKMLSGAVTVKASGEEGVKIMHALLGLGDLVTNVNVPNVGQISNLPLGAVVETNAVLTRDSVRPIAAGAIASPLVGVIARHVANQQATVEAGLNSDNELALRVLMNDPLAAHLSRHDAQLLFSELLASNIVTAPAEPARA